MEQRGQRGLGGLLCSLPVAGFLAAVLWFDLMFDVQVLGEPEGQGTVLPEPVLASISSYYRRVLIDASPMGRLVGITMLVGWVGVGMQLWRRELHGALGWATALLLFAPTTLAAVRVVPYARRLAMRRDSLEVQSDLARTICFDHQICLAAILAFIALQLWQAVRRPVRANRR